MRVVKKIILSTIFRTMAGFQAASAATKQKDKPSDASQGKSGEKPEDAQKKIQAYPKDISIQASTVGNQLGILVAKGAECPESEKDLCFAFKVKTPEEEIKIRKLKAEGKFELGTLNGILIDRNYFKCIDSPSLEHKYLPAFCFGSISVSSHVFIDAFGEKSKNKDLNIKDPIYFDANFANIDLLWDNRWLGIGAAVATSTVNLQKAIIFKAGLIVQSDNVRAEFGWLRVGLDSGDNNGLYFGISIPLIGYASTLKEKIAGK